MATVKGRPESGTASQRTGKTLTLIDRDYGLEDGEDGRCKEARPQEIKKPLNPLDARTRPIDDANCSGHPGPDGVRIATALVRVTYGAITEVVTEATEDRSLIASPTRASIAGNRKGPTNGEARPAIP